METVLQTFLKRVRELGDGVAFQVKGGGAWEDLSWNTLLKSVLNLSRALGELGVSKGDSVAIFSNTRFEWTVIDLAIMSLGAATVPIYHTLSLDQIAHILNHSCAKIVFVEDALLLEKVNSVKERLIHLQSSILIEGKGEGNEVPLLPQLMKGKIDDSVGDYTELIKSVGLQDVASIIYTSGTTGEPKGAELTHANIVGEIDGLRQAIQFERGEVGLLFLPLAHVVARAMQFYQLCQGCVCAYAESVEKLPENIVEVRPHFMVVVPRVMEKIYEKIVAEVEKSSTIRKLLFHRSLKIGKKASRKVRRRRVLSLANNAKYWLVQKLVFSKLHKKLGGRIKLVISGGAPLSKDVAEFFHAVGCLILEGYGLTETMAAITINRPDDFKFGTVGKPLSGVKIHLADDGEILVKGTQVFKGYKKPLQSADKDAFEDGWFMTGDLGEFSRDGFLRITGRKKELIVTSAGKNIVPHRVEEIMKSSSYIKDVLVYGDRRKYLSALVVLDSDKLRKFAADNGITFTSLNELINNSATYQLIKSEIECKNRKLARHETIKKFVIIEDDFSQERGELTPTLKVKRESVFEHYKDQIENMYGGN
jgi:long-chain acyl-CoA synthetase